MAHVFLSDERALLNQVQPSLKVHCEQTWERCDGYPEKSTTCYVSVFFLVLMEAPSALEQMRLQVMYRNFLTTHINRRQNTAQHDEHTINSSRNNFIAFEHRNLTRSQRATPARWINNEAVSPLCNNQPLHAVANPTFRAADLLGYQGVR